MSQFIEMFPFKENPYNWPILSFCQFASIDATMTSDFETYADYPHIGIDSIEQDTGRLIGYRTVRADNVKSGKYIFTANHIIYSKIRPNLNKVATPDFTGLCSADSYPILPNTELMSKNFLVYLLRSETFLEYIIPLSNRTGMPKVNRDQVEGFSIPGPPLPLQEQFVAIAEQADKSGFDGIKSQFIEMLTPLWDAQKTIPLDSMIQEDSPITYGILMPGHHVEDGVPVVKVKDMVEGKITMDDMLKTSKEIDEQYKRSRLRENDVLLSIRGTIGRVAVIPQELNGANITQDTARLRLKPQYDPFVLKYVLESPIMQFEMEQNKRGATIKGINIGYVREMPIPWPESKEQVRLKAIASQSDKSGYYIQKLTA